MVLRKKKSTIVNSNMAILKIIGKTIVKNSKIKVLSNEQIEFQEFSIWNFNTPSETTNINNFSVGFDSGSVLGDWGSGYQTLQSNQPINVTI
jgi:hypothetical protein